MTRATGKMRCIICNKEKITFKCKGCLEEYCYNHLGDHKQELNKQLDQNEINRDIFRQSYAQQIDKPKDHILIQKINQWETNSIKKIQQAANEARQMLLTNINEYFHEIEIKLNNLTNQLREIRQENDFNEIHLHQFEQELNLLVNQFSKPSNISITEDFTPFISKISVNVSGLSTFKSNIYYNTTWIQNGFTIAGGNGKGHGLNQLSGPFGIDVAADQSIYIADFSNHRVVEWKCNATNGQVVAGGNGQGNQMNQLNHPTDVIVDKEENNLIICDFSNRRVVRWSLRNGTNGQILISNIDCSKLVMDNNGDLYVSDRNTDEVRRWKMNDTVGTLVAGGNGKGNGLNQLNGPTFIFVDKNYSVYVSDEKNHRVMEWMKGAKEGIIVAGGRGQGNDLTQLSRPQGLIVDHWGTVYVADFDNHRVMRWPKGATQGTIVVGENGKGQQANQFRCPSGLSFDREGNLYVADCFNARVQRFNINQSLI